jgi:ComF family protein
MDILSSLLDLIAPTECKIKGCNSPLKWNERYICSLCLNKIRPIEPPYCSKCGKPINEGRICVECQRMRKYFSYARVYGRYEGVLKEAIHLFKYEKKRVLSNVLGELLDNIFDGKSDIHHIVPVPLSKKRKRERGFNQTELLARVLSRKRGIPIFLGLLKVVDTPPQVGLPLRERKKNLKDSFVCKEYLNGNSVVLIDDVITTGATVNECSKALLKAGAKRIFVLALSCA